MDKVLSIGRKQDTHPRRSKGPKDLKVPKVKRSNGPKVPMANRAKGQKDGQKVPKVNRSKDPKGKKD